MSEAKAVDSPAILIRRFPVSTSTPISLAGRMVSIQSWHALTLSLRLFHLDPRFAADARRRSHQPFVRPKRTVQLVQVKVLSGPSDVLRTPRSKSSVQGAAVPQSFVEQLPTKSLFGLDRTEGPGSNAVLPLSVDGIGYASERSLCL